MRFWRERLGGLSINFLRRNVFHWITFDDGENQAPIKAEASLPLNSMECDNSVVKTLVIDHCYAFSLLFSTEFARTIALVLEHLVKFRCGEKHIKKTSRNQIRIGLASFLKCP